MLVDRRTFYLKPEHANTAVQMMVAENHRLGVTQVRFYLSMTGRFNTLVGEWEFENLAAYEKFWKEWGGSPEATVFLEKFRPLNETVGTHELWNLVQY